MKDKLAKMASEMQKVFDAVRIGDRVRCIKPVANPDNILITNSIPRPGAIYTIREKCKGTKHKWARGFTFEEIINESACGKKEPFFGADCFEPIVKGWPS